MKARTVLLFVLLATVGLVLNDRISRAAKNKAVIQVETRLIEVNVVTRDSHGHPIKNLTKGDFKLYDNGKEVPIDVFSELSLTPATPKPLPPNVYANRVEGAPPSITVVLLDGLNTKFSDQVWARTQVVQFLEKVKPQDHVAIMLLGSRLFLLQNFTSNPKILLAALKGAKATSPKEVEASAPATPAGIIDAATYNLNGGTYAGGTFQQYQTSLENIIASAGPSGAAARAAAVAANPSLAASAAAAGEAADKAQMAQVMLQFQEHTGSFFAIDRVQRTLEALTAIANYLAQFPGRKNLIWVSSSFPIQIGLDSPRQPGDTRDQIHFMPQLEQAYRALNNADLAVYPVDARGLTTAAPGAMDWNGFYSTQGVMQELASNTGGQAFMNTNDLARVMQAAVDDSDANYTIGFYPQNINWNGKYHTLTVKVDRPGVHLRYRRGYFATRETSHNEVQESAALNRAIFDPLDSTAIGLRISILKFVHVPSGKVLLGIDMDADSMSFQGGGNADLSVALVQLNALGTALHTGGYDMKLRVAPGGVPRLKQAGLKVAKWVDLVDGAETLVLVVRDPSTGRIGSVRVPLGKW